MRITITCNICHESRIENGEVNAYESLRKHIRRFHPEEFAKVQELESQIRKLQNDISDVRNEINKLTGLWNLG